MLFSASEAYAQLSLLVDRFYERLEQLPEEELMAWDEWFVTRGYDLLEFYGIEKELDDEEKQRFLDYIYVYSIAHDKREFDERYDQPLFNAAYVYAKNKGLSLDVFLNLRLPRRQLPLDAFLN